MLFDERDLAVFDNKESREYFVEILQSYYSKNYRASIVLLYAFVIFDLFNKLRNMANEGDNKAKKKIKEIDNLISDDEKYSTVENLIIDFYKSNCPLYFNRFVEDIEYLKNCRNKCAHLKVDDSTLYCPKDYQARMLICSMYDNILSVKAPFITDLFAIAQSDVEHYASIINGIYYDDPSSSFVKDIQNKYIKRMTYDSIKKSYKTFLKLSFISESEECQKYLLGLYAFSLAITDYCIKNGYSQLFTEPDIADVFIRMNVEALSENDVRRNALISIMVNYPILIELVKHNNSIFEYLANCVLKKPQGLKHYRLFYPRSDRTSYKYFVGNEELHKPSHIKTLYDALKDSEEFDMNEFMLILAKAIPSYNAFSTADNYMTFFIEHIEDISKPVINEIVSVYNQNNQCKNRGRHQEDMEIVKKYLTEDNTSNNLIGDE